MLWFPNEACHRAVKWPTDINLPPLLPDKEKKFSWLFSFGFKKVMTKHENDA